MRTIIKCCTSAGTLSGRSQLSETGNQLYTCSHSLHSGYAEVRHQFLLERIGDKSDLGTEIIIPLDKQGCSSLDSCFFQWKGRALQSPLGPESVQPQERKRCSLDYTAVAAMTSKWLLLQTETCLGGMKQQHSLPFAQLFISTYHQPS